MKRFIMIFNCSSLTCTNYGDPYRVFQYTNKSPGETCHLWFRASVSKHSIEILRGTACTFSSHSFFLPFNGFWMVLLSFSSLAFSRSSWHLLNALFIGETIQRWLLLSNDSSLTFLFSENMRQCVVARDTPTCEWVYGWVDGWDHVKPLKIK